MASFSNEAIIAIVTLVTTIPSSVLVIWHLIRRRRRIGWGQEERSKFHGVLSHIARPLINSTAEQLEHLSLPPQVFIDHVNLLVAQPGLAYLPDRS